MEIVIMTKAAKACVIPDGVPKKLTPDEAGNLVGNLIIQTAKGTGSFTYDDSSMKVNIPCKDIASITVKF